MARRSCRKLPSDIIVTADQMDQLISLARACSPDESCAILYGRPGRSVRVDRVHPVDNADASPASFAVSDEDLLKAYRLAEQMGRELVGIFHSHPDSEAFPSGKDQKFMEINPIVWLIYSGRSGQTRAYTLDGELGEIPVIIDSGT